MKNSLKLISFIALLFIIFSFTFRESKKSPPDVNAITSITIWPYCKGGYCTATKQGTHTPVYLWYHSPVDAWYTNVTLDNAVYDIFVCCGGEYGTGVVDLTNQNHDQDTVILFAGSGSCLK